jgi:hypothetical protein
MICTDTVSSYLAIVRKCRRLQPLCKAVGCRVLQRRPPLFLVTLLSENGTSSAGATLALKRAHCRRGCGVGAPRQRQELEILGPLKVGRGFRFSFSYSVTDIEILADLTV